MLNPKQVEIITYNNKYRPIITILEGAIRSGKTYLNNLLFYRHVAGYAGQGKIFYITGYTIGSITRNVLGELEKMFGLTITLDNLNRFKMLGNWICCFGTDNANSHKSMTGATSFGWLANEVTLSHPTAIAQAFKRQSGEGSRVFMDTNPAWPKHPIKTDLIDKSGELLPSGRVRVKSWHFTIDDNPSLSPDYVEMIKSTTPSGYTYDRDINGKWVAASGVVYPDFNENIHVISQEAWQIILGTEELFPLGWEPIGGIDFGFTNPFVYLLGAIDKDGRLYIFAEHYKSGVLYKDHAAEIKIMNKGRRIRTVADHEDAQGRSELRKLGISTKAAQKAVKIGIQAVAKRLVVQADGRPRLYFVETVRETIREFGGYCWPPGKEGLNQKEEPLKKDDHGPDTVRYMIMDIDYRKAVIG